MAVDSINEIIDDENIPDFVQVKNFCRVDGDLEDDVLKMIVKSAKKTIIQQVGDELVDFYKDNFNFDYAVLVRTYHSYYNRDSSSNAMNFNIPDTYRDAIITLKNEYNTIMYLNALKKDSGND